MSFQTTLQAPTLDERRFKRHLTDTRMANPYFINRPLKGRFDKRRLNRRLTTTRMSNWFVVLNDIPSWGEFGKPREMGPDRGLH